MLRLPLLVLLLLPPLLLLLLLFCWVAAGLLLVGLLVCWCAACLLLCQSAVCLLEALRGTSGNVFVDFGRNAFIHGLLVFVLCQLPLPRYLINRTCRLVSAGFFLLFLGMKTNMVRLKSVSWRDETILTSLVIMVV